MSEYTVDEILNNKCLGKHKRCGVYKITNIVNKKIYIGSSKSILQRWRNHIRELNYNSHSNMFLQDDWNTYGKYNFIFEILENCSETDRYIVEQKYLNELFPFYRSDNGYNIAEKSTQRNESNVRLFKPERLTDNYYIVKAKGCKPHVIDGDHCKNTSRDDLENECFNFDTYKRIRHEIIEQCGFDDWEW